MAAASPIVCVPFTLGVLLLLLSTTIWSAAPVQRGSTSAPPFVEDGAVPPIRAATAAAAAAELAPAALRAAAAAYMPDVFDPAEPDAPPAAFLPEEEWRNPCWRRASDGALRCLPLVHVLGGYQCGSSDLFARLSRHDDFARPSHAAPSFYFEQNHKWPAYVRTFERAAAKIAARPRAAVSGEGSAGMLTLTWTHSERLHQPYITTMGARWQLCNANRTRDADADARFNACMAAHIPAAHAADAALVARAGAALEVPYLLRAVQGTRVRLIALLRNPTDRLYAAFWHYPHYRKKFGGSEAGFAAYHAEMAAHAAACAEVHGVDACALRFESLERRFERVFYHCDQHYKGLYAPFVRVWARAYAPEWRSLALVLTSEGYAARTRQTLERVFAFVGLRVPADEGWWARALGAARTTNGVRREWASIPPMRAETRAAVDGFYAPHNADLAALLGDDAFRWDPSADGRSESIRHEEPPSPPPQRARARRRLALRVRPRRRNGQRL
ncbi:hypothetical protein KFE25_010585 [Diacronema lutheri]|uniref:Sulfotransferase domain-containing protein n=1 Tax=Diacronema lutheri TaxID=2081491 RepID=A0A8J5XCX7_DIALT|nr:hypothetical protein KFE25_010585 [Diacronema lutheri]